MSSSGTRSPRTVPCPETQTSDSRRDQDDRHGHRWISATVLILLLLTGTSPGAQENEAGGVRSPPAAATEDDSQSRRISPDVEKRKIFHPLRQPAFDPESSPPQPLPQSVDDDRPEDTSPDQSALASYDPASGGTQVLEVPKWANAGRPQYLEGNPGGDHQDWLERYLRHGADSPKNFSSLTEVQDTTVFPFSANVLLDVVFEDTAGNDVSSKCSGTLIDARFVITAGHCIHDLETSSGVDLTGWAKKVTVYPAYKNGSTPFGSAVAYRDDLFSWNRWIENRDHDHDIGVIRLDRPVGALTGWHGYGWRLCLFFRRNTFEHAGYPGNSFPAQNAQPGRAMFTDRGDYDRCHGREVRYRRVTYGGQSGSGSFKLADGSPIVYAVLSNGTDKHSDDTRLTSGKFEDIGWILSNNAPGTPDLIPLDVRVAPQNAQVGEQLGSLSFLLLNYSFADWSDTVHVEVYLSEDPDIETGDTLIARHPFEASLGPKDFVRLTFPEPPTLPEDVAEGDHYLGVRLNYHDADDDNNYASHQDAAFLSIRGVPDLTVADVDRPDKHVFPGAGIDVEATIENIGTGTAFPPFTVKYVLSTDDTITDADPVRASAVLVDPIGRDEELVHDTVVQAPFTPGTWWLGACLDPAQDEVNLRNQCSEHGRRISVAPNLTVTPFEVTPTTLNCGESFESRATVWNSGTIRSDPTTVHFYRSDDDIADDDDLLLGSESLGGVNPGTGHDATRNDTAVWPGPSWIRACVDPVRFEFDVHDQCSVPAEILITGSDLSVPGVTVKQNVLSPDEIFTIDATVANSGNAESGSTTLRYYLSGDATIETSDSPLGTEPVSILAPGGIAPMSFVTSAPGGTWYVGACVDPVAGECDTANQCSTGVPITVNQTGSFATVQVDDFGDFAADGDLFGHSLAISGDLAVAGAYLRDAVDPDRGTPTGDSGAAFLLRREASGAWVLDRELVAEDADSGDRFGKAVAVSGETVMIGAPAHDERLPDDSILYSSGSVYVFERQVDDDGTTEWGLVDELTAGDMDEFDFFGDTLALAGNVALIGAPADDDGGPASGSVYVFENRGDGWIEVDKLVASNASQADQFGKAVSISGNTAVVGAYLKDGAGIDSGAAYVFQRDPDGTWQEVARLTASDPAAGDRFGNSVAIDGDTVVVGSPRKNGPGLALDHGAVYVFTRDQGGADNWGEVAKLSPSDADGPTFLGASVAITGDTIAAGAYNSQDFLGHYGAVYVFERNLGGAGSWTEVGKLSAGDEAVGDHFGAAVAVSEVVLVGAPRTEDGGPYTADSGALYVFAP